MSEFLRLLQEDANRRNPRAALEAVVAAAAPPDQEDTTEMEPLISAQSLIREVVSAKPDIRLTHALEFIAHFMAAESKEDQTESAAASYPYSPSVRSALADKGHALPDGHFPIREPADVDSAIGQVAGYKGPHEPIPHIKKRAAALGVSHKIPPSWM